MSQKGGTIIDVLIGCVVAGAIGVGVYVTATMDKTGRNSAQLGRQYDARAKELEKIPEHLLHYEEQTGAKITSGFETARAVAAGPKDTIYVAGDKAVRIYAADGSKQGEVALEWPPLCLAVATDGTLYVGLKDKVAVIDAAGTRTATWKALGENSRLSSIGIGKDRLFVADVGLRVVHVYDRVSGEKIDQIGEPPKGVEGGHFNIPSPYFDLVVANGVLSIVNPGVHKIEHYRPDASPINQWGRYGQDIEGFCGCCNPVNVARLPDGSFVTSEKGLTRIKVLDAEGKLTSVVAGPDAFQGFDRVCASKDPAGGCNEGGLDIAVDSQGRVLVLDPYTGEIRIWVKKS